MFIFFDFVVVFFLIKKEQHECLKISLPFFPFSHEPSDSQIIEDKENNLKYHRKNSGSVSNVSFKLNFKI